MTLGSADRVLALAGEWVLGWVTLEQAAELAGVSKSAVQRRVAKGTVPARAEPDGVVTISRADVQLIEPRAPADDKRKAVMVRVPLARYRLWKRAAKEEWDAGQHVARRAR